ncbi:antilisterial bacteriocin subtilosin biosynthesis protein AlbA [archaeon BMS3Bbin15]|nr:antilisterial bacteriocin subtilosin biosynthesis protein AlbA [archaeon BMS3Bbin15]
MNYLKYLPQIIMKKPVQLTFFITRRCNSACPYCFYLRSTKDSGKGGEAELREIKKIAEEFKNLVWLAFSGGEIFLREDIAEITKAFYDSSKPAVILLPTNGLMPEVIESRVREILDYCTESSVVVKLSLDAVGDKHDEIRGVKGNFSRLMDSYRRLAELKETHSNLDIGINTLYSGLNEDYVEEVIEFVKKLDKVSTHTLSLIRGELVREDLKQVDYNRFKMLSEKLERERKNVYSFRGAKLKTAQDVLQKRLIYKTAQEERRVIPCYAGRLNLVITENLDVYPCEILNRKMGNLRESDYSIQKVLSTGQAEKTLKYILKGECYCTHECYFITNILFNPKLYPSLAKEYLRLSGITGF